MAHHHHHHSYDGEDYDDEMPFAVDDLILEDTAIGNVLAAVGNVTSSAANTTTTMQDHNGMISASLTTASAVASLAQRCSHSTRLKLFERGNNNTTSNLNGSGAGLRSTSSSPNGIPSTRTDPGIEGSIAALTDQLADFHSFGASLRTSTAAATTSTRIAERW
jgi:hypothetical protein